MTEERITTTDPVTQGNNPNTHTTTIIREEAPKTARGSGASWFLAIVLLIAVLTGIYIFTQMSASETSKNNAVAGAAEEVGDAAREVGAAASKAGSAAEDAVDNMTQ